MACRQNFLECNGMCSNGNKPCEMEACNLWDNDYSGCHDYRNEDYADYMEEYYQ
jgi:hypothetical protein